MKTARLLAAAALTIAATACARTQPVPPAPQINVVVAPPDTLALDTPPERP